MMVQWFKSWSVLVITCLMFLVCGVFAAPTYANKGMKKQVTKKQRITKKTLKWRKFKKGEVIVLGQLDVGGKSRIPQPFYFHRTQYKRANGVLKPKGLLSKVVGAVKQQPF